MLLAANRLPIMVCKEPFSIFGFRRPGASSKTAPQPEGMRQRFPIRRRCHAGNDTGCVSSIEKQGKMVPRSFLRSIAH
jgi:hypothetical protein